MRQHFIPTRRTKSNDNNDVEKSEAWNTDTCYNMNESWKHAKIKKLDTRGLSADKKNPG
jgi:hypothetical protein